ncbi:MAG: YcjF family protein [Cyanobacteriota bacterium]|nr:YcjF family protein [Cyanobacteriota bacterium]
MKLPALLINLVPRSPALIGRVALITGSFVLGQWVFTDVIHLPGGGLGLMVAGAGVWWLSRPSIPARFDAPDSVQGWIRRCKEVLDQFEDLEEGEDNVVALRQQRSEALDAVLQRSEPQKVSFVNSGEGSLEDHPDVQTAIAGSTPLSISWARPLSQTGESWVWPAALQEQDVLLYVLPLPLMAADLLWLERVPANQPIWLIVSWQDSSTWVDQLQALQAQLPQRLSGQVLRWTGNQDDLSEALAPVRRLLEHPQRNLEITRKRLLGSLHRNWQAELEQLRRQRFLGLQQRTQWLVAGAVFASPLPTTDLLAVAVVNGLMIKEMAGIWKCSLKPEVLQLAARQLAGAALAQGVVEWSGQALLGVAKLDGSSWLAAGTVQALSAAYLTRVVGRSMADWLALNSGVAEPDLEALKIQAPLLVAKAAEQERLDWSSFSQQGISWIKELARQPGASPNPA